MVKCVRRLSWALDAELPPTFTLTDQREIYEALRIELRLQDPFWHLHWVDEFVRNNQHLVDRFKANARIQTLSAEVGERLRHLLLALKHDQLDGFDVYAERAQSRCDQLERELAAALARGASRGKARPQRRKVSDEKVALQLAGTEHQPGKTDIIARRMGVHPSTIRRHRPRKTRAT
jgi:hypothetical protein